MNNTKTVKATKVETTDNKSTKQNFVKRGINAGTRCCSAMKRIFMSIAARFIGWKGTGIDLLAKFSANFLTVLGWLFFSIAWTPALAHGTCQIGTEKLNNIYQKEKECLDEFS